jgi:hypothetical protein
MADKKISQLSAASTPLAGTEVLPIVQSSATVKVATNDLTVRNVRANATTGILQVTGPTAASTRVMTVPDANFTAARTDAANSFTGDQTLATGNIVQGTAAKGFEFSANTAAAGMTSELLNWYEEGTWTPVDGSGAGLTFSSVAGYYTRIGRQVVAVFSLTYPITADASAARVAGLPFTSANTGNGLSNGTFNTNNSGQVVEPSIVINDTKFATLKIALGTSATNVELSGATLRGGLTYFV